MQLDEGFAHGSMFLPVRPNLRAPLETYDARQHYSFRMCLAGSGGSISQMMSSSVSFRFLPLIMSIVQRLASLIASSYSIT